MQIRYATDLSAGEYVRRRAWRNARLDTCPLHPEGGCRLAKHGTYSRVKPRGTRIARFRCGKEGATFSLLPDCLSSRLSGSLIEAEAVMDAVENASSQEAAADAMRPDIGLPGVLRWMRRRILPVRAALAMLIEALPGLFGNCLPAISSFRSALGSGSVLPELRAAAEPYLAILPPPVGFGPRPGLRKREKSRFQHKAGPDPP